jgi:hypothetical protein
MTEFPDTDGGQIAHDGTRGEGDAGGVRQRPERQFSW